MGLYGLFESRCCCPPVFTQDGQLSAYEFDRSVEEWPFGRHPRAQQRRRQFAEFFGVAGNPVEACQAMLISAQPNRTMRRSLQDLQRSDLRLHALLGCLVLIARHQVQGTKLLHAFGHQPHAAELLMQHIAAFDRALHRCATTAPELRPRADRQSGKMPRCAGGAAYQFAQREEALEAGGDAGQPDTEAVNTIGGLRTDRGRILLGVLQELCRVAPDGCRVAAGEDAPCAMQSQLRLRQFIEWLAVRSLPAVPRPAALRPRS